MLPPVRESHSFPQLAASSLSDHSSRLYEPACDTSTYCQAESVSIPATFPQPIRPHACSKRFQQRCTLASLLRIDVVSQYFLRSYDGGVLARYDHVFALAQASGDNEAQPRCTVRSTGNCRPSSRGDEPLAPVGQHL